MKNFDDLPKNSGQLSLREVADKFGISETINNFLPGRFYSLKITSPVVNLTEGIIPSLNSGKPYLDLNPFGLVLFNQNFKETVLVLNLKVIPAQVSAKLLEAYYYFSKQNGLDKLFKDGKLIPLSERRLIDQRFYLVPQKILSEIVGFSNLNYAINKYNIEDISEAKLIDWDNFGMMIRPKFSQVGIFPETINMQKVFEDFMTNSIK